jgi:hypothetical protein
MWMTNLAGRPEGAFDPYAQDRQQRYAMLNQSMGAYDQAMSAPLGFLSPSMKNQVMSDAETNVRNQYQGQGQAGFVNDRVARAKNDALMKMTQTNLDQANKQRDWINQMTNVSQPTAYQPAQQGLIGQFAGNVMGNAANTLGGMGVNYLGQKIGNWFGNDDEQIKGVG